MTDDLRKAISIIALIFFGPTMLLTSTKDMVAEWHEVSEMKEENQH